MLIPLLFMGDIVGRLFREFAVTLAVTILISAVVSLTLTPMMCARLLQAHAGDRAGPVLPRLEDVLRRGMIAVLRPQRSSGCSSTRRVTLVVAVGTLVLTVLLYIVVPKGFFPCRTRA